MKVYRCMIFGHEWIIRKHTERIIDWETKEVTTDRIFMSHCIFCGKENPGIVIRKWGEIMPAKTPRRRGGLKLNTPTNLARK